MSPSSLSLVLRKRLSREELRTLLPLVLPARLRVRPLLLLSLSSSQRSSLSLSRNKSECCCWRPCSRSWRLRLWVSEIFQMMRDASRAAREDVSFDGILSLSFLLEIFLLSLLGQFVSDFGPPKLSFLRVQIVELECGLDICIEVLWILVL